MSINASAIRVLNDEFKDIRAKIDFAFDVQKLGNENKIGINQGGNVKDHTLKRINFVEGRVCNEYVV